MVIETWVDIVYEEVSLKFIDLKMQMTIVHFIIMNSNLWFDKKPQFILYMWYVPRILDTLIHELGGTHGCYPVLYRRHPFCFCLDSFVIVVIYIHFNCLWELLERGIVSLISIIHLILHSSKKCLHNAIIIAVAFPRHGLNDSMLLQCVSVGMLLILLYW